VKLSLCLTKHHAMKAYWGVEVSSTHFLPRHKMEVSGQLHAPAALPPPPQGKSPWYPLDRRLGEPQSRSGCCGEEENSQHLPGIELFKLKMDEN
jgi:hypothetical protein